ncbi:hypothetical protein Tco_1485677 [Tanacetum coccineum]
MNANVDNIIDNNENHTIDGNVSNKAKNTDVNGGEPSTYANMVKKDEVLVNKNLIFIAQKITDDGGVKVLFDEEIVGKALGAGLVVTDCSETESEVQNTSNMSRNGTDTDDADIRLIYDEKSMAEVQLTDECNIFSTGQQLTEQPEIINEGRVDQYTQQSQIKSPMLDSSIDNKATEFSNPSLQSENILLKKTVAQFQKDFSRIEAHCIALELKYQNQSIKSGQHG